MKPQSTPGLDRQKTMLQNQKMINENLRRIPRRNQKHTRRRLTTTISIPTTVLFVVVALQLLIDVLKVDAFIANGHIKINSNRHLHSSNPRTPDILVSRWYQRLPQHHYHQLLQLPLSSQEQEGQRSSSSSSSTATAVIHSLNPIETWCMTHLSDWYRHSLSIKCPFLRRRSTDVLDGLESVMRFLVIRHKSLPLLGPPLAWTTSKLPKTTVRPILIDDFSLIAGSGTANASARATLFDTTRIKTYHLSPNMLLDIIENDWRPSTSKGYYLTGKLTQSIYRDDCLFDGPDPDMPVRGLHKYLNAASQLFETKSSTAELLGISIIHASNDDVENEALLQSDRRTSVSKMPTIKEKIESVFRGSVLSSSSSSSSNNNCDAGFVIVAEWRLSGVLHLPWHPKLPTWTGRTIYHFDSNHLVKRHEEEWDISVLQAFTQTLWPQLGNKIWHQQQHQQ